MLTTKCVCSGVYTWQNIGKTENYGKKRLENEKVSSLIGLSEDLYQSILSF